MIFPCIWPLGRERGFWHFAPTSVDVPAMPGESIKRRYGFAYRIQGGLTHKSLSILYIYIHIDDSRL